MDTMTIKEAIDSIHAPKGISSIIAGVMVGDFSVLSNQKEIEFSFDKADEMVDKYKKQLEECKSDWSYWAILGDLGYWKAVRNILEAGKITWGKLPRVQPPSLDNCVVTDAISKVERYGLSVLNEAKKSIDQNLQ